MKKLHKLIITFMSIIAFCSITVAVLFGLNATGILRFLQTSISIKIDDINQEYDGTPLDDFEYTITNGYLLSGDTLQISTSEEVLNAGEYSNEIYEIRIINSAGNDVTSSYNLSLDLGDITIEKRELILRSDSDMFPYEDGEEYSVETFTIAKGSVANTDYISETIFDSYDQEGVFDNYFSVVIRNLESNEDVTYNYDIYYEYGYIIIGQINISGGGGSGGEGDLPKVEYDPNQVDGASDTLNAAQSSQYGPGGEKTFETVFEYSANKKGGTFLSINAGGDYNKKGFDKAPVYIPKNGIYPQNFMSELLKDYPDRKFEATITYVSIKSRTVDLIPEYPILTYGQVSDTYAVASDLRSKTITVEGYYFDYVTDINLLNKLSLKDPKYIEAEKDYRKHVYENYLDVPDSTKKELEKLIRQEGFDKGNLYDTVVAIQNYFKRDYFYNYKGLTDYLADDILLEFTKTKEGDCSRFSGMGTLLLRIMGYPTRTLGGFGASAKIPYKKYLVNPWGGHQICETYIDGIGWVGLEFTVAPLKEGVTYPPPVTEGADDEDIDLYIGSNDYYKEYDGKPLTSEVPYILEGELKPGHQFIGVNNNSITDATSIENTVDYMVVDSNFNDVTSQYKIREDFGKLQIDKKEITVETPDLKFEYDGTEKTFDLGVTGLVPGHKIRSWSGDAFTEKGTYVAIALINEIVDENGNNVKSNYRIIYKYGHVVIK